MNKKVAINNNNKKPYPNGPVLANKENKAFSRSRVTEGASHKCNASRGTTQKVRINTRNNEAQVSDDVKKQNVGQRHVEHSLQNDAHYENVNITIPSSIPEFNRNHPILTSDQSIARVRFIENCIALSKKYIAESNYHLARQEAKKGMNFLNCSNLQKIELAICLSYSCFTFKDCLDALDAIQSVLVLPECNNCHKIGLFNNASLILRTLKDYRGAQEAALSGVALTNCISTERIPLLHNLALAYKGLNDSLGQIRVLHSALMNPECNRIQQFTFFFSLSIAYSAIDDEDASLQYLQAALNLKKCKISTKIHILNFLYQEWTALADHAGAQKALLASRALTDISNKCNIDLSSS